MNPTIYYEPFVFNELLYIVCLYYYGMKMYMDCCITCLFCEKSLLYTKKLKLIITPCICAREIICLQKSVDLGVRVVDECYEIVGT